MKTWIMPSILLLLTLTMVGCKGNSLEVDPSDLADVEEAVDSLILDSVDGASYSACSEVNTGLYRRFLITFTKNGSDLEYELETEQAYTDSTCANKSFLYDDPVSVTSGVAVIGDTDLSGHKLDLDRDGVVTLSLDYQEIEKNDFTYCPPGQGRCLSSPYTLTMVRD